MVVVMVMVMVSPSSIQQCLTKMAQCKTHLDDEKKTCGTLDSRCLCVRLSFMAMVMVMVMAIKSMYRDHHHHHRLNPLETFDAHNRIDDGNG